MEQKEVTTNIEQLKQEFSEKLARKYALILDTTYLATILLSLQILNLSITLEGSRGITKGHAFKPEEISQLSHDLYVEKSREARSKILLKALAGKGLEEEFLEKLRESH